MKRISALRLFNRTFQQVRKPHGGSIAATGRIPRREATEEEIENQKKELESLERLNEDDELRDVTFRELSPEEKQLLRDSLKEAENGKKFSVYY